MTPKALPTSFVRLSARARNALARLNICSVPELRRRWPEVTRLRGCGSTTCREIAALITPRTKSGNTGALDSGTSACTSTVVTVDNRTVASTPRSSDGAPDTLKDIVAQIRALDGSIKREAAADRRAALRRDARIRAASLLLESFSLGAFGGSEFIQMRGLIEACRSIDDPHLRSRQMILIAVDELAGARSQPRLHSNDHEAIYRTLADGIESQIGRIRSIQVLDADRPKTQWITQTQAAELLRCSERTIQRRIEDGTLGSSGPMGRRRVSKQEVEAKRELILNRRPRSVRRKSRPK